MVILSKKKKKMANVINNFAFFFSLFHRVEIIRLSDKSFKETIKDAELSTYRSTTKEGYVSLDPSKPLPHEFEEGKLSRYNDHLRQKYLTSSGAESTDSKNANTEHELEILSQYANANDSVILNKTEFRGILMNALSNNNNDTTSFHFENIDDIDDNKIMSEIANDDRNRLNHAQTPEIKGSHESESGTSTSASSSTSDDIIYPNQTLEKFVSPSLMDTPKKSSPISLDTPEVDKLLNGGNK